MSIRERGGHDSLVKNIVTRQLPITYSPGRPSGLCTNEVGRPRSPTIMYKYARSIPIVARSCYQYSSTLYCQSSPRKHSSPC